MDTKMADTLPNIFLPPRVWVDIYAALNANVGVSITVGTQILAQNIGVCDVYLTAQAAQPTDDVAHNIVKRSQFAINDQGDAGAWAYCRMGGLLNVRIS
jgi:hypothetical protein